MKKSDIIAEYNRAEIHYQAMKCLMKSAGITPDDPTPAPTPTPTPTPEPTPTPTTPGIVYNGDKEIFLKPGDNVKLEVWFNGVSSTADYVVIPNISSLAYSIAAFKTSAGYKDEINVKGISGCSGVFKMYLKSDPENGLTIKITVRG